MAKIVAIQPELDNSDPPRNSITLKAQRKNSLGRRNTLELK